MAEACWNMPHDHHQYADHTEVTRRTEVPEEVSPSRQPRSEPQDMLVFRVEEKRNPATEQLQRASRKESAQTQAPVREVQRRGAGQRRGRLWTPGLSHMNGTQWLARAADGVTGANSHCRCLRCQRENSMADWNVLLKSFLVGLGLQNNGRSLAWQAQGSATPH